ncbi:MAG: phytanoyl-CoA dioxygenase family protein [Acidimicrobiia bacterium]|nr:phytanoyl-CoA dioxygenase family protein [Acidimicrobiia bacterium]
MTTQTAAALEHFEPNADSDAMLEALRRDAAIVIERLVPPGELDALRAELDPHLDATPYGEIDFHGNHTRRVGALIARSPECGRLAAHPLLVGLAEGFLGPFCDEIQLHFTQAVRIDPGESAQMLHRDRGVWGGYLTRKIETQLSTIWALDDFTAANGATRVVPGSHTWHRDRTPEPHEIVPAEMPAGSVLVYSGSVLHGGGANTADHNRRAVLLHYTLGWLRQEENQYLSCPPEVARSLDPELRRLIGYQRGGILLGFYSPPTAPGEGPELVDPGVLFDDTTS